jgi:diacylglycerol kinase (ATP)
MKVLWVIKPVAGGGKANKVWTQVKAPALGQFPKLEYEFTEMPGHATHLACKAVKDGYDTVVAVGGDGTVHEIANGLAGKKTALAIIPAGTGNDLARVLRIPLRPEAAVQLVKDGKVSQMDLGCVEGSYFINMVGIGFDAAVAHKVMENKRVWGKFAYFVSILQTLSTYNPVPLEITIDGVTMRERATLAAVANGEYVGGGVKMCPQAIVNDGLLDVCVFQEASGWEIMKTLPLLYIGKHINHPKTAFFRGKEVVIKKLHPYQSVFFHADGQIQDAWESVKVKAVPAALNVMTP